MSGIRSQVRLAARSHARHRGFASLAVLSLALAIALNTTMYSMLDALVNPSLNVVDPHRLYLLQYWGDYRHRVDNTERAAMVRSGLRTYEAVSSYQSRGPVAAEHGRRYQQASLTIVAPDLPRMLGVRPLTGRNFVDADFTAEAQPVMITDRLAATLFLGGEQPIGATVDLDGAPHPVIGLLRAATQFPKADIWMLPLPGTALSAMPVNLIRVRKAAPVSEVEAELEVLAARIRAATGEDAKSTGFTLRSVIPSQFHYQRFHLALIAAVVAVLLIACANLANLQLARGLSRRRELAIRSAVGASRRDILAQLVVESAVLAFAGLALGLVLAIWSTHLLRSRIPPSVAGFIVEPQTSWRVFAFAAVSCVLCILLVGALPAIRVSRIDPADLLKSGAGTGANKKNRSQYGLMVGAQVALSLALLCGALILMVSELRLREFDGGWGFDPKPLTHARMLFRVDHDSALARADFLNQTLSRVRSLPDVAEASVAMIKSVINNTITVYDAGNAVREVPAPSYGYSLVTSSAIRTYGLSITRGRDFLDGAPGVPEVIVDERTAGTLWPNADPIGKPVKLGDSRSIAPWARVVGVVGASRRTVRLGIDGWLGADAASAGEREKGLGRIFYAPDIRDSIRADKRGFGIDVVVRAKSDPDRMPIILRRSLLHTPPLRLLYVESMEQDLRDRRETQGFIVSIFYLFAALAIALAALGIYGIVAHSVAERKRELGVRIALGATPANILGVVLREGNAIVLGGIAFGLLLTKITSHWLQAFAFENAMYDAPMFAAAALALFGVAVLAAFVPALRATRIDPVESLRIE
jgi:putative ABC transport system permease protein